MHATMKAAADIDHIKISSFAAPTAEDIAVFESLTDAQRAELIRREVQRGIDSGVSDKTMADVWSEALRRVKAKADAPDAL